MFDSASLAPGPFHDDRETRRDQMFPVLDAAQIETARALRQRPERALRAGRDASTRSASSGAPAWLVLDGSIEVVRRDGLSREAPITDARRRPVHRRGQPARRPPVDRRRRAPGPEGCTALPFDAAHLRALMVGSAELGEIVMRALILRRVGLIEEGGAGTILIGVPGSPDIVRLQGFLTRSGYPNLVLDAASDEEGRALVERIGVAAGANCRWWSARTARS